MCVSIKSIRRAPGKYYFIAFLLIAFMLVESLVALTYYSTTFDETSYIGASYYHWKTGNITIAREHPPLTRIVAGAPLILLDLEYPEGDWNNSQQWEFGKLFLYKVGNDLDSILLFSRLPTVFLSLLLGLALFVFVSKIYGYNAGIFALFLYVFESTIIAHSSLATTDIAISLFMFLTIYAFWYFIKNPSYKNAIFVGLFFALAQVSKFSALYLIPIIFVLLIFFIHKKFLRFRDAFVLVVVIGVVSLFIINLFYLFQGTGMALTENISKDRIEPHITGNPLKPLILAVVDIPVPLPENYMLGLSDVILHDLSGHSTFLLGEYSRFGWWYYFPVVFVLKVSIFLLLFIGISTYFFYKRGFETDSARLAEYIAIIFILMYFGINLFSHINIGIRHILPVFPFVIFLASKSLRYLRGNGLRVFVILAVLYAISSVLAAPHYISFFSEAIGSENGYKYTADSNVDWGQDIESTFLWLNGQGINEISYRVQGSMSVAYYAQKYNVGAVELDCTPASGIIVISAAMYNDVHNLDGNHTCFDWLKDYKPVERIGNSIFIYKV